MTATELRKVEARCQRALARYEVAIDARDRCVRLALAEGWTHALVAEALGLSRGRINQIAQAGR